MFNKKKKIFIISGFFFLLFLSSAIAQDQSKRPFTYENKELGIRITGPQGWFATSKETNRSGPLVVFSPNPLNSPNECFISLVAGPLALTKFKTPLEVANAQVLSLKTIFKDLKIIKEPAIFTHDGQEGVNFIFEGGKDISVGDYKGRLESNLKNSVYIFIKNNTAYFLYCSGTTANFDDNLKEFQATVSSLVLK
ncbi:MAG: hypothetical protein PHG87_06765 [Candidatus Omnitrophica bacterium]|nr:hypothetical protein [Candidatus Omnitrophota bacterium]